MTRLLHAVLVALPIVLAVAGSAGAAELMPFKSGAYAALLGERAGQKQAVHFWSLTCAPCLVELPRWAAIARAHPELQVTLVNTDPPAERAAVAAMIERLGVGGLRTLQFDDAFTDRLMFEVDPAWHGELPRTSLIGRDGTQRKVLGALDDVTLSAFLATQ